MATRLDIDVLVEIHDENELKRVLDMGVDMVGINNRNLRTFEVDLSLSEELVKKIPSHVVTVVESGLKTAADIKRFKDLGVHAVLIGETFMRAQDVGQKVDELMAGDAA